MLSLVKVESAQLFISWLFEHPRLLNTWAGVPAFLELIAWWDLHTFKPAQKRRAGASDGNFVQ
jgi:hypothetical protein